MNEINKTTEQIHTLHKNIEDTVKRIDVMKYETKTIKEVTPEKLVISDGGEIIFKERITDEQVEAIKNETMSIKDFYELLRDNRKE